MNVSKIITMNYKNLSRWLAKKNKPKQTQSSRPLSSALRSLYFIILHSLFSIRYFLLICPSAFCFLSSFLCVFSLARLVYLSIMDCKIANIEDMPFVRRNQLPAASARASVTAQPAAIITIIAKMMYFTLTSRKKRSKKRKYTPKTAITRAKSAITTSTQHNNAQAGWI